MWSVFTSLAKGKLTGGDIQYGKWCIFTNNTLEVVELMCSFAKGCFVEHYKKHVFFFGYYAFESQYNLFTNK